MEGKIKITNKGTMAKIIAYSLFYGSAVNATARDISTPTKPWAVKNNEDKTKQWPKGPQWQTIDSEDSEDRKENIRLCDAIRRKEFDAARVIAQILIERKASLCLKNDDKKTVLDELNELEKVEWLKGSKELEELRKAVERYNSASTPNGKKFIGETILKTFKELDKLQKQQPIDFSGEKQRQIADIIMGMNINDDQQTLIALIKNLIDEFSASGNSSLSHLLGFYKKELENYQKELTKEEKELTKKEKLTAIVIRLGRLSEQIMKALDVPLQEPLQEKQLTRKSEEKET
ncbi:MAG: hypothetical protein LBB11_03440, partial [Puniceicoccales bacterium]|nr:hypothetical protein [Puniceicoccales bacterium]